ncbi:MAG: ATP-binding protein [Oscillospiraceae bacterium]
MKEIHREVFAVFDTLTEAVTAVNKDKIVYANAPARELFGDRISGPASEIFDALLLSEEIGGAAGSVKVGDRSLNASSSSFSGLKVITVRTPERDGEAVGGIADFVSTSIKNSLAVCRTGVSLLKGRIASSKDEKLIQYTAMLDKSCRSIVRTVENFSKLCGGAENAETLNSSTFDIVELCSDLMGTVRYLFDEQRLELSFQSDRDSLTYYGDGDKLERMLLNLISNSIKYTPDGGKVVLSVKAAQSGVMLTVRDNGRGIPQETLSAIFDRYNGRRDLTDGSAGAGLGLSLVQQIARLHGGSAVVESRLGEGTAVTVMLPYRKIPDDMLMDSVVRYKNDMSVFLTELSDVLDTRRYRADVTNE